MATREPAPTYREPVVYDQPRNKWIFDPHWLRWLNMLQTQLGALGTTPGHAIEDEGVALADQPIINFVGAGVTATNAGGKTVVTIPGGVTNLDGGSATSVYGGTTAIDGGSA